MPVIPYSGIRDKCLAWPAANLERVTLDADVAPGTLANYSTFVLTIREDPEWPRSGSRLVVPLDPAEAGGTPIVQATGTADVAANTISFSVTTPTNPGYQRYAIDVKGTGGTFGPNQLYLTTWLTILPIT